MQNINRERREQMEDEVYVRRVNGRSCGFVATQEEP